MIFFEVYLEYRWYLFNATKMALISRLIRIGIQIHPLPILLEWQRYNQSLLKQRLLIVIFLIMMVYLFLRLKGACSLVTNWTRLTLNTIKDLHINGDWCDYYYGSDSENALKQVLTDPVNNSV